MNPELSAIEDPENRTTAEQKIIGIMIRKLSEKLYCYLTDASASQREVKKFFRKFKICYKHGTRSFDTLIYG
jgi:hypothetical protein